MGRVLQRSSCEISFVFLASATIVVVVAFQYHPSSVSSHITSRSYFHRYQGCPILQSVPLNVSNDDGNFGGDFDQYDLGNASTSSSDDGQALANEFYRQLKLREANRSVAPNQKSDNSDRENTERYNRDVFMTRKEVRDGRNRATTPVNKDSFGQSPFKGRKMGELDSTGTPSAGLFAREYGSVYSFPVGKRRAGQVTTTATATSSSEMPRSEFLSLLKVSSSEHLLLIQAVILVVSLAVVTYVGMNGGITDGSDRFGFMDDILNDFNGLGDAFDLVPLVTDTAVSNEMTTGVFSDSVWL